MNFISKFINGYKLNKKQKEVNKEYEENGLTEEVLEKQIEINMERNRLNIPDPTEQIFGDFVQ